MKISNINSRKAQGFLLTASVVLALAFIFACESSGPSALVGKWVHDDSIDNIESFELFKDGTGIAKGMEYGSFFSFSIQWKVIDKRFVMTVSELGSSASEAYDYEISGRILTLTNDKGKKGIYVRPQEGKIEGTALTDNRDSKKYKTVIIGLQTWMAENLNFNAEGSKCYDNDENNCQKYGRLYNWNTAIKACPDGWHLPSGDEWHKLANFVGGESGGKKLKAKSGWNRDGNGTDEYGFSTLPGGFGFSSGGFDDIGDHGRWWSSTEDNSKYAQYRHMHYDFVNVNRFVLYYGANVDRSDIDKTYYISVRCIQGKISNTEPIKAIEQEAAKADVQQVQQDVFNDKRDGKYPQASERLLTSADLQNLSKKDLRIMRNEIFARHGYIFESDDLKEHFKNQNWYTPKYSDVNSMLTDIETENIQFIKSHE